MKTRRKPLQRLLLISIFTSGALSLAVSGCSERTFDSPRGINTKQLSQTMATSKIENELSASIEDPLDNDMANIAVLPSGNSGNVGGRAVRVNFTNLLNKQKKAREIFYLGGVVSSYVEFTYQTGALVKRTWYTGAGVDGIWFNADDVISAYTDFASKEANVNHVRYTGAGVDTQWFTADDVIEHYEANLLDAAGGIIGEASYYQAGADASWFTADDTISSLEVKGKTTTGDRTWVRYTTAGADADWTTLTDNTTTEFRVVTPTATAQPQRTVDYSGVGVDGKLFTADDVVVHYRDYTYDSQNEVTQSIFYGGTRTASGAGADGKWFTADDLIRNCRQLERDAANIPYRTITTRPGVDAACFTADDVIRGYHQDDYNAAGAVTKSVTYTGSGVDVAWFTADDVIDSEELFVVP